MMRPILMAMAAWSLAACASLSAADEQAQLDRVWNATHVLLPMDPSYGLFFPAELPSFLAKHPVKGKLPAVVFMHGCDGRMDGAPVRSHMNTFVSMGYAVFAPDSLARPHAPYCDARSRIPYFGPHDISLRIAEAKSTVERLRAFPWIDQSKILLVGHSMGGITTVQYPYPDFRAHIALGWDCMARYNRQFMGEFNVPSSAAVMTLIGDNDDWYRSDRSDCGVRAEMQNRADRKGLTLSGGTHDIIWHPRAVPEIKAFLKQNGLPSSR